MDFRQRGKKNYKKKVVRYQDLDNILKRIQDETPKRGDYLFDYKLKEIAQDKEKLDQGEFTKKYKVNFKDLPISTITINGLKKRNFNKLSEIQRCTIPHSIAGRDIMGASKTGSGKTLSYLIPVIEILYQKKWMEWDGLGGLIILPTRELAIQVFDVLNSISENHELSVGLVIGGNNLKYERENIHRMNILVATPGRLLQHMDETPGFNTDNLQILVIDEADMLFELGFAETLNAVLENLPSQRQTLLFSATLSKNVHQLGKLSLTNPEYVFLHDRSQQQKKDKSEKNKNQEEDNEDEDDQQIQQKQKLQDMYETPLKLMQYYMPVNIEDKLNCLFSFLKAHQKQKVLVFFATCKQVRFAYETFKKLKVGLPILELHGRQKAKKRMALFYTFSEKKYAALFTTNLAARGLDFPQVNWVIQVDIPENCETYIHRIGRTARFKADGKSLLFVTPQEEQFVQKLKEKGINLHKILQNPQKQLSVTNTLQAFCSEDIDLKYLAQRAFISYMKFVHLNGDGKIFNVHKIPIKELAESLGLIQTPIIKFKKNLENDDENQIQIKKQKNEQNDDSDDENSDENQSEEDDQEQQNIKQKKEQKQEDKKLTKFEKLKQKRLEERTQRKNKKSKIDIIHMKESEQEIEQQVYKELQSLQSVKQKHNKLKTRTTDRFNQKNVVDEKIKGNNQNQDEDDSESDGEFLVKKVKVNNDSDNEENNENNNKKNQLPQISKRQLGKIKMDGHYGGANKLKITDSGKYITPEEEKAQELKENLKRLEEEEAQQDLVTKYQLKKVQNEAIDQELFKKRIKEKSQKRKQKQRQKEMDKMGEDFVMLGGDSQEIEED